MATKPLEKQPSETHLITFDFSSKMSSAEIISSMDSNVSDPADVTFDVTPTVNTQTVDVLISGGVAPSRSDVAYTPYKLTMIVTTDIGQVLEKDISLNVQDS